MLKLVRIVSSASVSFPRLKKWNNTWIDWEKCVTEISGHYLSFPDMDLEKIILMWKKA